MLDREAGGGDITHTTLSVLVLLLLAAGVFWVLRPFATAIIWATIVSVTAWPLLLRLEAALGGRRSVAVAIMTVTLLLVVFVPVTLALVTIVKSGYAMTSSLAALDASTFPAPPDWLRSVPLVGDRAATAWRQFQALTAQERSAAMAPYLQTALAWFAATAGSIGTALIQFLLTTIVSAILLAKGETVRDGILRFAYRLGGRQGEDVAQLAARAIRGVVVGVVGTALIQTTIGGAGLLICGIPAAGLLTAVMLFLCLAQLGPILVMVPAVIWLYWSGHSGWGTTLVVFTVVAGAIDNFIRPILIKRGADLPLPLIFAGVIGGLIAFGVVGLFIGPVVLTVTYTLLRNWVAESASPAAAR